MRHTESTDDAGALHVWLLGGFRVAVGPRSIPARDWRLRKATTLVKLLALAPQHRIHREQALELLWPEAEPETASNTLHRTLHVARRVLEPALKPGVPSSYLALHGDQLLLCPADTAAARATLWTDVDAFEAAAATARRGQEPAAYRAALDLYSGELLPEDRYADWAAIRRQELARVEEALLEDLARLQASQGDLTGAVSTLERLIAREPTREEAHVGLMRLYALAGQRYQALRQYQLLRDALQRELAIAPEETTTRLYRAIQAGHFPPPVQPRQPSNASAKPHATVASPTTAHLAGGVARTPPVSQTAFQTAPPLAPASPPSPLPPPPVVVSSNLPVQLTSFIGRERDLATVKRLLSSTRLLTLTGAGGSGKTRLALQVAADAVGTWSTTYKEVLDGVWLVELAALADPTLVPQVVARTLGLRDEPGQSPIETLVSDLAPKHVLLLLDNCEHLVDACAAMADTLLRACPHVRLLATSRQGLGIGGETLWRVPLLAVPDPEHLPPFERLPLYDAVRLFLERARASRPEFVLTPQNASAIVRICQRVDGMPLALELAAARVNVLAVEQIATRLDDVLSLLTTGSRTSPRRQQTLRATLDWSHDLLSPPERALFRRLAVFAGGWTLEAAEGICAVEGVAQRDVLDLLAQLVDKSLVLVVEQQGEQEEPHAPAAPGGGGATAASAHGESGDQGQADEPGEHVRYRLLESIRQYAVEHLRVAPEADDVYQRHAEWYLALAESAEPNLRTEEQMQWLARLEAEHGNLRAALRWALEHEEIVLGLRLGGALGRFWFVHGHLSEGLRWLQQVLEGGSSTRSESARPARAKALDWAGFLAHLLGDNETAVGFCLEALALCRELGDSGGMARALDTLAMVAQHRGDYGQAITFYEEALAHARDSGNNITIAASLNNLAGLLVDQGLYERGEALFEESLDLTRAQEDQQGAAITLNNLGELACRRGDYRRAVALSEESLSHSRASGDTGSVILSLTTLGIASLNQGDVAQATALLEEALEQARAGGAASVYRGAVLRDLSQCAYHSGDLDLATRRGQEAVALFREADYKLLIAEAVARLARIRYAKGHAVEAAGLYRETVELCRTLDDRRILGMCLEGLAEVCIARGQAGRAARLLGAAEALRAVLGEPLPPIDRPAYDRQVAALRTALGRKSLDVARAQGQAWSIEQVIAEALAVETLAAEAPAAVGDGGASAAVVGKPAAPLSQREREVAALVTVGRTNREIAAELHLAGRTVDTHVSHILGKLRLASRAEVAAWVKEHDLVHASLT